MSDKDLVSSAEIEVRPEGIYIVINNSEAGEKITRQKVLSLVEQYGIKDIDFEEISKIFKSDALHIESKISSNTNIIQKDEEIVITKSSDKREAYIKFIEPVNGGKLLSSDCIKKIISDNHIKFGILEGLIENFAINKEYDRLYLLATALLPTDGKDGYLDFKFDITKKTLKPKLLENGNVDYRNLELVEMAKKGDVLVSIIEPTEGIDGIDVCGNKLKCKLGKKCSNLPKGSNVYISEDGKELIAGVTGQINYVGDKVNMSSLLEISENVGNNTGNIEFNGSVIIKGGISAGFSVIATGNIEVLGFVEGAYIKSDAHIFLQSGVQGSGKAIIEARGDIFCKYIENCKMTAGGNITSEYIIHSSIECLGKLELIGNKATVLGGLISVKDSIVANDIGSSMGTATELKVGNDPQYLLKYTEIVEELKNIKNEFNKMNQIVEILEKSRKLGDLNVYKQSQYVKALHTKEFLIGKKTELETELVTIISNMNANSGSVIANNIIHSGVSALIGNALIHVRDDIFKSKLINDKGKVVIVNL